MTYEPSKKFLGVWVTTPLLSKKSAIMGHDTRLEGLVPIKTGEQTHEFHSSVHRILGHPDSIDYNGNGPFNLFKVVIGPVFIGWTRNAGKSFITDDDLVAEKGLTTVPEVLYKLHAPGALKPNR